MTGSGIRGGFTRGEEAARCPAALVIRRFIERRCGLSSYLGGA